MTNIKGKATSWIQNQLLNNVDLVIIFTVDVTLRMKFLLCFQEQKKHTLISNMYKILFVKKNNEIINKLLPSRIHLTKKNRKSR